MSQKTYQRSKFLIQVNNDARMESLWSWIISLANAKSLFKIIVGLKLFYLLTDFQNVCCTFYDNFSGKYCWENILPLSKLKYSSVFRENRCPQPPKPVYGGKFSHESVTLKIRSRSPKSNKLLILSDLYRLANLVTFHPMVHEITCRQTLFGLILVDYVWQWPLTLDQGHQNLFSFPCKFV